MSLDRYQRELGRCTFCPKLCRFCCPTAEIEHKETVTPWAKMSLAELVRTARLTPDADVGEVFSHCFLCLHCRTHCRHQNDVPAALVEARARSFAGHQQGVEVEGVLARLGQSGNPWGEDLRRAFKGQLPAALFEPEAQVAVFAGCEAIRAGRLGALFALFGALGIDTVAIDDGADLCCGLPLYQAGDLAGFHVHARRLGERLAGYRKVICPCPACTYVFRGLYGELELSLSRTAVNLLEFLEPVLAARAPARKLPGTFTFHDPCYLGRYLDRCELPRKILAGVIETPLREATWSKADALCCGGGGLVPHTLPQVAGATAKKRMDQLRQTGAAKILTACPGCVRMLGAVPGGVPVLDVVDALLEAYRC